ncbi:MAG: rod shape-determining protein MreD [Abditibacteriaceae bacterium]
MATFSNLQPIHQSRSSPSWRAWLVLWVAVALQTTWLAHFSISGAHLDLPLLCVVSSAMLLGARQGVVFGFVAGLLSGYTAGISLGSFVISRMAAGGLCGLFDRRFSVDNPLAPPICAAVATLLSHLIFGLMSPASFVFVSWMSDSLLSAALHAVLIWPFFAFMQMLVPARNSAQ